MIKERFLELVKQSPMTVREISEKSGLSESTINKWIYGIAVPTVDKMECVLKVVEPELLSTALGCEPRDLM